MFTLLGVVSLPLVATRLGLPYSQISPLLSLSPPLLFPSATTLVHLTFLHGPYFLPSLLCFPPSPPPFPLHQGKRWRPSFNSRVAGFLSLMESISHETACSLLSSPEHPHVAFFFSLQILICNFNHIHQKI